MKTILVLFCLISISYIFGEAIISFEETGFDFGEIKEENGSVFHRFTFYNDSEENLIIEEVKTS